MPDFVVTQRQVGEQTWLVEASSQAEAIRIVQQGNGDAIDFLIVSTGAYRAQRYLDRESGGIGEGSDA